MTADRKLCLWAAVIAVVGLAAYLLVVVQLPAGDHCRTRPLFDDTPLPARCGGHVVDDAGIG